MLGSEYHVFEMCLWSKCGHDSEDEKAAMPCLVCSTINSITQRNKDIIYLSAMTTVAQSASAQIFFFFCNRKMSST